MKKPALLFCLLLSLSCTSAFGQVPSYFKDGARWVYSYSRADDSPPKEWWAATTQHIIHGDTLLAGITYNKLFTTRKNIYHNTNYSPLDIISYDSIGPQYIRHDTAFNRVYFMTASDSPEVLLYDFNLSVGDTLPLSTTFDYLIIDSVVPTPFWGDTVKYIFFHGIEFGSYIGLESYDNYLVEGMGGTNGLLISEPRILSVSGGRFTQLQCFQFGDSIYAPSGAGCPFLALPNSVDETKGRMTALFGPNPFSSLLYVSLETETSGPASITIRNLLGQEVFKREETLFSSHQTKTFDLSHLTSGLYFVEITIGEHRLMRQVVKAD